MHCSAFIRLRASLWDPSPVSAGHQEECLSTLGQTDKKGGHCNSSSRARQGGIPGKGEFPTPGYSSPLRASPLGAYPQPYVLGLTLFLDPLQVT